MDIYTYSVRNVKKGRRNAAVYQRRFLFVVLWVSTCLLLPFLLAVRVAPSFIFFLKTAPIFVLSLSSPCSFSGERSALALHV